MQPDDDALHRRHQIRRESELTATALLEWRVVQLETKVTDMADVLVGLPERIEEKIDKKLSEQALRGRSSSDRAMQILTLVLAGAGVVVTAIFHH